MNSTRIALSSLTRLSALLVLLWLLVLGRTAQSWAGEYLFHDSHFHLTNYVQQGTDIRDFLKIMGDKVGRVMLSGIPLQQQWMHASTGEFAPTYYTQTDAPLYYYSFTDAAIAMAYKSLPAKDRLRFDPMISWPTGAPIRCAIQPEKMLPKFPLGTAKPAGPIRAVVVT